MKGVCFKSVGEIETIDLPDPEIQDSRDAIVKVSMAGLCGSDLHVFHGREVGVDVGTVMGHELVGEVVAVVPVVVLGLQAHLLTGFSHHLLLDVLVAVGGIAGLAVFVVS